MEADPFLLVEGDSIIAKLVAVNEKGTSPESSEGSGAIVIVPPTAP